MVVDGGVGGWVGADQGWMRDWNPLLLKSTSGVTNPASDARIFLTECRVAEHHQRARNGKTYRRPSSCSHGASPVILILG
jgi:hypothetical protein